MNALKQPHFDDNRTQNFVKRQLLQQMITDVYRIRLFDNGYNLVINGLDLREESGTLTREQILSGSWKTANLRKYDVTKLPRKAYPGKIHPYQRIIAEMREILL